MQTIYYTTSNFIRHTGNVINLAEYRSRAERGPQFELTSEPAVTDSRPALRRRARRGSRFPVGLLLDFCASGALLVLTVVVLARFLAL